MKWLEVFDIRNRLLNFLPFLLFPLCNSSGVVVIIFYALSYAPFAHFAKAEEGEQRTSLNNEHNVVVLPSP